MNRKDTCMLYPDLPIVNFMPFVSFAFFIHTFFPVPFNSRLYISSPFTPKYYSVYFLIGMIYKIKV